MRPNLLKYIIGSLLLINCAGPLPAQVITDAQIRDIVTKVANHQIVPIADGDYPAVTSYDDAVKAKPPQVVRWAYPWGVTLYGLLHSVDVTGSKPVTDFVCDENKIYANYYEWLASLQKSPAYTPEFQTFEGQTKIGLLMKLGTLDSCGAMGAQMLQSMLDNPDRTTPAEKVVVARIADWIANKQMRLPDGTLCRKAGQVWPDDLYMSCPFLIRWAKYTGDKKYLDDAASQVIHQAALEQDTDGLWFHGYSSEKKIHSPFKWGRGNGWATVTMVEILSDLPKDDPARPQILSIFKKQIDGLKAVQAPDGMWRQVLDKPQLWEETSCTAMFAYGIARAVNRGWLDPSYMKMARAAFSGISQNVTPDGVILNACTGTGIGQTLDFYIKRPRPVDEMHGRGPVLLAGSELLLSGGK